MNILLLPRGIRNNNPGNIRLSKTRWQGQSDVQTDPDFITFKDPLFGLRALMRLLLTYYLKHGLDTVESLINRYAPPCENATDQYARVVAQSLHVRRRDTLDLRHPKTLIALAAAITRHENGTPPENRPPQWYATPLYDQAAAAALETL